MAQRNRAQVFRDRRRDRHAAKQILRRFCGCTNDDLTRTLAGWLERVERRPPGVKAGQSKTRKTVRHIRRRMPRRITVTRKEVVIGNESESE
jgi:hypothetical protein